jgi:hypothetical protein
VGQIRRVITGSIHRPGGPPIATSRNKVFSPQRSKVVSPSGYNCSGSSGLVHARLSCRSPSRRLCLHVSLSGSSMVVPAPIADHRCIDEPRIECRPGGVSARAALPACPEKNGQIGGVGIQPHVGGTGKPR